MLRPAGPIGGTAVTAYFNGGNMPYPTETDTVYHRQLRLFMTVTDGLRLPSGDEACCRSTLRPLEVPAAA